MAYNDFVTNIQNADIDAQALSAFMQAPASSTIERRIAGDIKPLQHYLDYFDNLKNTSTSVVLKNVEVDANRQAQDKYTPKNILFIGDSLTEPHTDAAYSSPRESYARVLADMIASVNGGYKQVDYVSLSTQNAKDLKEQISITRSGYTDMWGDSDHRWSELPYRHSPDGRGFYTTSSNTTDYIYVNTTGLIAATKVRLFYLKQPNGGQIRFGYGNQASGNRLLIDTNAASDGIGVAEIDATYISNRLIISGADSGKPVAVYGIQIVNDNEKSGITYNVFARSGSMLQEHNQLASMTTYYQNIAPDVVFLNIGTNDALQDFSRLSPENFKTQLQTWVARLRNVLPNTRIYLIEPNQSQNYGVADSTGEGLLLEQYSGIRKQVASENTNVIYVDVPLIAGDYQYFYTSDFMLDVVHPNAKGKYHIAKTLFDVLSLNVAPMVAYTTQAAKVSYPHVALTPKFGKQNISTTAVTLAKYGLTGSSVNAYFDLKITLSVTGKQMTGRLRFYATKTSQTGNLINDIRTVTSTIEYRHDASSSLSTITLNAIKNADGVIEITAQADTWTPTEWVLSGNVQAAATDFLAEI